MSTTTIREILGTRPLHSVGPETPLREVARLMAAQRVGAVAVLEGERLAGIVSERDIVFRAVAEGLSTDGMTAAQVMTADPVSVEIDAALPDALAAHLGEEFRHMPVTEAGKVVGLLSYRDIPAEYVMLYERFREMRASRADDGV